MNIKNVLLKNLLRYEERMHDKSQILNGTENVPMSHPKFSNEKDLKEESVLIFISLL